MELARSGDYTLAPVAVEKLGAWGPSALELGKEIEGCIARCSGDTRSTKFLRQRLSIAVEGKRSGGPGDTPAGSSFCFPENGAAMNNLELDYFMINVQFALNLCSELYFMRSFICVDLCALRVFSI